MKSDDLFTEWISISPNVPIRLWHLANACPFELACVAHLEQVAYENNFTKIRNHNVNGKRSLFQGTNGNLKIKCESEMEWKRNVNALHRQWQRKLFWLKSYKYGSRFRSILLACASHSTQQFISRNARSVDTRWRRRTIFHTLWISFILHFLTLSFRSNLFRYFRIGMGAIALEVGKARAKVVSACGHKYRHGKWVQAECMPVGKRRRGWLRRE